MSWFQVATLTITSVGLFNCLIFCIAYAVLSRGKWWKTEEGKFLMVFMAVLGSLFALIISNRLFGDWPGRRLIVTALYLSYVVATFWPIRLLWKARQRRRLLSNPPERGNP